ncbi:MAG: spore germination protein GerW family protein [Candidatus Korobacteraceae bacterium]
MINPKEMLETLVDHLAVTAQVQNVFGEPIEAHGRTVIPVARVSYSLGAGGGSGEMKPDESGPHREGGGGGGGGFVRARPVGVLEITESGTRFIGVFDRQRAAAFIAGGVLIGVFVRRALRWKR